jgi:hypothetical protein
LTPIDSTTLLGADGSPDARPTRIKPLTTALGLGVAVVLAAGCGQNVLDANEVSGEIAAQIERLTGADVASVSCPTDVEAKAGATFTCTVNGADGTSLTIDVEQTSDEGALAFEAPILPTTETEEIIAKDIGSGATVDCPELVLAKADATFSCELGGTQSGSVEVTLTDDAGGFEYEITS